MPRTGSSKIGKLSATSETGKRVERQRLAFELLCRLVEGFDETLDVGAITDKIMKAFVDELGVERASLYLAASEGGRLEPFRSMGIEDAGRLAPIELDSALVRWLRESDGPVHLDEFFASCGEAEHAEEESMRRLVEAGLSRAVPLAVEGAAVGILLYGGVAPHETLNERDADFARMVARVAAVAVKNALFHQATVASMIELDRFSEVKREFINRATLDLGTPLSVLKSALWSLEPDEVDGGVLVDMAKDAVSLLQNKIDYVVSLNEVGSGATGLKLEPYEVSPIVEDVLREMIPELEEKQVRVAIDDHARYRKALIDPPKIAIVIRSLLGNALSSVGRGGNITITIRVSEKAPGSGDGVEIGVGGDRCPGLFDPRKVPSSSRANGASPDGSRCRRSQALEGSSFLVIGIQDDGIGIPESEIEALASPQTMTNNEMSGFAITLSVSRKVVAGHGGKIFCKSELGCGAQFSIWLPID